MKAIRQYTFGAPEVLQLEEVPDPVAGPGQVVVTVHAAGVNPVETYIRSGIYPKPPTPFTLGNDGAGIVESVGDEVETVSVGDRVYIAGSRSGTYAEKTLCNDTNVFPLSERAGFSQGAAVYVPYGTAHQAMFHRGRARAGETVFIHGGSGGVGIAAIQFARNADMTVIASGGTDRGRALILEQGAHHVLDHTKDGYLEQLMTLTDGRGADLIMEMLANVNLSKDLDVVAQNGRIVVIGNRGERNQGTIAINPRAAMARDADILGMNMNNASRQERGDTHAAIVAGLEDGTLQPVIGQEFPLAEAAAAHHAVIENRAYGKIVLLP